MTFPLTREILPLSVINVKGQLLIAVIYFSWYKARMNKNLLTTQQAATELGVNDSRVRQLIRAGELKAQQFGRAYLLEPSEVQKLVGKIGGGGKTGRPPKALGGPTTAKPAQTTAKLNRAFREATEAEEASKKKATKKGAKR